MLFIGLYTREQSSILYIVITIGKAVEVIEINRLIYRAIRECYKSE